MNEDGKRILHMIVYCGAVVLLRYKHMETAAEHNRLRGCLLVIDKAITLQ